MTRTPGEASANKGNNLSKQPQYFEVMGIKVEVARRNVKHMRLAVCAPDGHVRVVVPTRISDDTIREAVSSKLKWIHKKQLIILKRSQNSQRSVVTGETHLVQGEQYKLNVIAKAGPARIRLCNSGVLELSVRPDVNSDQRKLILQRWYRKLLQDQLPALVAKWEPVVGVQVASCRIKNMKTRWGSCNIAAQRIWISLALAQKPPVCLEYVLVHEMTHLHESNHGSRFRSRMELAMPLWRTYRDLLENRLTPEGNSNIS